jgi:probable addiction module antidote protein
MTALSKRSKLNRENLYRMLSKNGNPEIRSILILLHAMGLKLFNE